MSLINDLNDYKLETSFESSSSVVHTSYRADRARGIRKLAVTERWTREPKLLGVGTFGTVRLEKSSSGDGEEDHMCRAVKEMHKPHMERLNIDYKKELIALTKFSRSKFSQSQLFVEFLGWFEDEDHIFIAMEYFDLGTLDIYIADQMREGDAQSIALQLLEGLKIMHEEGFTHRDLKPENIFIVQKSPSWWVKIGDFGISKRVSNNDTALQTATGTPYYLAPEVSHFIDGEDEESGTYTNAVDIWSFACVIYQILALQVPFVKYPRSLMAFCRGGPFPVGPLQERTSEGGIDFIKSVLVPLPHLRPTAEEALQSKWIQDGETNGEETIPTRVTRTKPQAKAQSRGTTKQELSYDLSKALNQVAVSDSEVRPSASSSDTVKPIYSPPPTTSPTIRSSFSDEAVLKSGTAKRFTDILPQTVITSIQQSARSYDKPRDSMRVDLAVKEFNFEPVAAPYFPRKPVPPLPARENFAAESSKVLEPSIQTQPGMHRVQSEVQVQQSYRAIENDIETLPGITILNSPRPQLLRKESQVPVGAFMARGYVPTLPGINISGNPKLDPMQRLLEVTIVSAEGLYKRDTFRFPDPFVILTYKKSRMSPGVTSSTTVMTRTLVPAWHESFVFSEFDKNTILDVHIFDKLKFTKRDQGLLGSARFRLGDVDSYNHKGETRDLQGFYKGRPLSGTILVKFANKFPSELSRNLRQDGYPTGLITRYDYSGTELPSGWTASIGDDGSWFYRYGSSQTTQWMSPLEKDLGRYERRDAI